MTLLSELIEKGSAHPNVEIVEFDGVKRASAHGVVIDVDDVTPPEGLHEIGFVGVIEDGEFSETTLDVVISAIMAEIDVTVEIPGSAEISDPRHMLATASSMGCSLALLPPESSDDGSFDAFVDRVLEFARAYVRQANMTQRLLPVSSYLEYLFIEVLDPEMAKSFAPVDPQIVSQFHEVVTVERADALKAKLRAVFHEAHGGEDEFRKFALSLMGAVYNRVEENCADESKRLSEASGDAPADADDGVIPAVADLSGANGGASASSDASGGE
jgi:hypothetical protein